MNDQDSAPQDGALIGSPRRPPPEVVMAGDIRLERWDPAWAEELHAAFEASLPELRPFMPWATDDHDLAQSREYIARSVAEWSSGENYNYAIVAADGSVIGSMGLMTRMGPGTLEIGYWVHTGYAGRGYATAATRALTEIGLNLPGVKRVALKHDQDNPASRRVAEKAGFVHVGDVESEIIAPGQTGTDWVWERRA
jgi:ribosomal-protein-serine acetyltransferase